MKPKPTITTGDCITTMQELPANSIDAIVTDPPYGIGFMGKEWDGTAIREAAHRDRESRKSLGPDSASRPGRSAPRSKSAYGNEAIIAGPVRGGKDFQDWCEAWSEECLRVLKPGGHLLAFGGSRTWHRLAVAIEDAGFEVRDSIAWLYGSGFPKSLRVSRDERYCHCDASVHTSSHTSPELRPDGRTRTEDAEALAASGVQSALRATNGPLDSPAGYRPGHGFDDELPHLAAEGALASALPQGCVPARSHSDGHEDGLVDESSRTPSPAQRSGRPSSPDSARPADSQTSESTHRQESTSPAGTCESAGHTPDTSQDTSYPYSTGFPVCERCAKPNVDGLGTALKPAFEPIVAARKPFRGTVAANVLEHGTGALNIDATRIGAGPGKRPTSLGGGENNPGGSTSCTCPSPLDDRTNRTLSTPSPVSSELRPGLSSDRSPSAQQDAAQRPPLPGSQGDYRSSPCSDGAPARSEAVGGLASLRPQHGADTPPVRCASCGHSRSVQPKPCGDPTSDVQSGRWPANVVLDEDQAAALDEQSGNRPGFASQRDRKASAGTPGDRTYGAGIGRLEPGVREGYNDSGGASRFFYTAKADAGERITHNGIAHPTVKPLDLMRWLIRLVTPPGGTVLDPFAGSGTTLEAAMLEGFQSIGIEQEPDYIPLIKQRINRRRDPITYLAEAGEDLGLFDTQ